MAQLRLGYPELQKVNAEVLQITHNTPAEAQRYFQRYPLVFPYLCDSDRVAHERYGLPLESLGATEMLSSLAACSTATVADLLRGEVSPSPLRYLRDYPMKDSPQAVFLVDRDGVIRAVHRSRPLGALPTVPELVKDLAGL